MVTFYRYKNENLGMKFIEIPELYRNVIRQQYQDEVKSGAMTIDRYEFLTEEIYPVEEEAT